MKTKSCAIRLFFARAVAITAILTMAGITGCDYARMVDDEAVEAYHSIVPEKPEGTVPFSGGYLFLAETEPSQLSNPLPYSNRTVAEGDKRYKYYCIQCHGPELEGFGTVGQSFKPLPTNLKSDRVQRQTDGELFYKIEMGFRRHPPLAYTMAEWECWSIVHFIRSANER